MLGDQFEYRSVGQLSLLFWADDVARFCSTGSMLGLVTVGLHPTASHLLWLWLAVPAGAALG
jgi:hypothetical protein